MRRILFLLFVTILLALSFGQERKPTPEPTRPTTEAPAAEPDSIPIPELQQLQLKSMFWELQSMTERLGNLKAEYDNVLKRRGELNDREFPMLVDKVCRELKVGSNKYTPTVDFKSLIKRQPVTPPMPDRE